MPKNSEAIKQRSNKGSLKQKKLMKIKKEMCVRWLTLYKKDTHILKKKKREKENNLQSKGYKIVAKKTKKKDWNNKEYSLRQQYSLHQH